MGNLLEPISLPVTTFKNGISNVKMIDKTRIAFQGNNLIIAAEDHNNLISLLSKVFNRMIEYNIKCSASNVFIDHPEVTFLGHSALETVCEKVENLLNQF